VTDVAAPKSLVQRHGLAPLASRAGLVEYRDDLVRATVEWGRIEADLPAVVTAMRDAGVRVAAIKGASYAKHLYGHPAERPMSDVDLLVPAGQRTEAERVLRAIGFELSPIAPVMHHAVPFVRGDMVIDLHWNVISPGRGRVDLDEVWGRTVEGWPTGSERLEPVDALAFHLIHLSRNRLRLPLVNIVDAARLAELGSPTEALERARTWGLHVSVSLAWRLCTSILDHRTGRPAGWLGPSSEELATLAPPSTLQKVLYDVSTAGSPTQLASRVAHVGLNKILMIARGQ